MIIFLCEIILFDVGICFFVCIKGVFFSIISIFCMYVKMVGSFILKFLDIVWNKFILGKK